MEDNSATSPAYTTFDLQLGYQRPGQWLFAIDIFNLSDVKWTDIEYYYVSRLKNETSPQPDYVVTRESLGRSVPIFNLLRCEAQWGRPKGQRRFERAFLR